MKYGIAFAICLMALPLPATTIVVSSFDTVTVHTGETLVFNLLTGNYSHYAKQLGLPDDPGAIQFALPSPPAVGGLFEVGLRSANGSGSVTMADPVAFTQGSYSSAGYHGAVSLLQGRITLSPGLSAEVFSNGVTELRFWNLGGDVTLGLPGLPIGQDLVLLVNSTAGGTVGLNQPFDIDVAAYADTLYDDPLPVAATPEPGTLLMTFTGLLGTVGMARRRLFGWKVRFGIVFFS